MSTVEPKIEVNEEAAAENPETSSVQAVQPAVPQPDEAKRDKSSPVKPKKPLFDVEKLKKLTVTIQRVLPKPKGKEDIERAIINPELITPVRRADEGKNPLFNRPEFRSRTRSPSSSSSSRSKSRGRSDSTSDEDRRSRYRRRRRYSRSRSPSRRHRYSRYDDRHRRSHSPYSRRDRHERSERKRSSQEHLEIVKHEDVQGNPVAPDEDDEEIDDGMMRHGFNGRGRGMRGGVMFRHPIYPPMFPPPIYQVYPPFPPPRPPRFPQPRY